MAKEFIIIEVESKDEACVHEYLAWWKENETSDNAYTRGPIESMDNPNRTKMKIKCYYTKYTE